MKLLLDTRALLEFLDGRLAARRGWVEAVLDEANAVHVSIVSLWEMALKNRIGKLDADLREVEEAVTGAGFALLPIAWHHLHALRTLPVEEGHRDPFDHLLIAQAIAEDMVFLTADRHAARYPVRRLS